MNEEAVFRAVADFGQLSAQAREAAASLRDLRSAADTVKGSSGAIRSPGASMAYTARQAKDMGLSAHQGSKGIQALANSIQGMGGYLGPTTQATAGFVQSLSMLNNTAGTVAITLGILAASAATTGIKFLQVKEQSQIAFTSILRDEAKAKKLMEDIIAVARDTPFETDTLTSAVRQLLAYGFSLEQVLDTSGKTAKGLAITIGETVSAMGGSQAMFEQISRAFGQMYAKGKVSGEELRQLAEGGIPVYKILQEQLGLTGEQVGKIGTMSISADVGIAALAKGLSERFGGAMTAQSKTMQGIISTLKDNVKIGLASAFTGLFTIMKSGFVEVGAFLTALNIRADEIGFINALQEKIPAISGLIEGLKSTFNGLKSLLASLVPIAKGFATAMAGGGLVAAEALLKGLAAVLSTVAAAFNAIPEPIRQLMGFLLGLVVILKIAIWMKTAIVATKLFGTALAALRLIAMATTASMTALAAGQGAAGAAAAFKGLGGALAGPTAGLAAMSSTLGIVAIGVVALAGGMYYFKLQADRAAAAHDSVSESADKLLNSLGIETTAWSNLSTEVTQTSEELERISALKVSRQFAADNKTTLDMLRKQEVVATKLSLIKSIAIKMVIEGALPEDAFDAAQKLADQAEIDVPLNFDSRDLVKTQNILFDMEDQAMHMAMALNNLPEEMFTGSEVAEDVKSIADEINNLMNLDPAAGFAAWAQFEQTINNSGVSGDKAKIIFEQLAYQIREIDASAGGSGGDLLGYLKSLATEATGVDEYTREMAGALAEAMEAGMTLEEALASLNIELRDLPYIQKKVEEATEEANKNLLEQQEAAEAAADAIKEWQEHIEDVASALDDFVDPMQTFSAVFGEVSAAGKKAAENAAIDAGLAASSWQQFATEAGLSLQSFADALQADLIAQSQWMANLVTVSAKYGPEVAAIMRDMGPEAAGIVKQMADDVDGEGQRMAMLLVEQARLGGEGVATELEGAMIGISEILADPDVSAEDLKSATRLSFTQLTAAMRTWGGEAGAAWAAAAEAKMKVTTPRPNNIPIPIADGGFLFSQGGFTRRWKADNGLMTKLPDQAQLMPPGASIVQWREPETMGEAFIPLAPTKRKRSMAIWLDTGRALGMISFGDGTTGSSSTQSDTAAVLGQRRRIRLDAAKASDDAKSSSSGGGGSAPGTGNVASDLEELAEMLAKNRKQFEFDALSVAEKIAVLTAAIADQEAQGLKYSDEWVSATQSRADLLEQIASEAEEAIKDADRAIADQASNIASMLDAQDSLNADLVEAREQRAEDELDINKQYNEAVSDANKRLAEEHIALEERKAAATKAVMEDLARAQQKAEEDYVAALASRAKATIESLDPLQRVQMTWGNTTKSIIDNIREQNVALKSWKDNLAKLEQMGISADVVEALGLSDPKNLDQVNQLLGASADEIAELNALWAARGVIAEEGALLFDDDLLAQRQTALEEAAASAQEKIQAINDDYTKGLLKANTDYMAAIAVAGAEQAESLALLEEEFAARLTEINAKLAQIGLDGALSFAQIVAQGLASGLPAIVAAAEAMQVAMDTTGSHAVGTGSPPVPSGSGGGGSAPPPIRPDRTLRVGDSGADVAGAKLWLNVNAGGGVYPEDGNFTPAMAGAVSRFQQFMSGGHFAGELGVIGPETWNIMDYVAGLNGSPIPRSHKGESFVGEQSGPLELLRVLERGEAVIPASLANSLRGPQFMTMDAASLRGAQGSMGNDERGETLQPVYLTLDGKVLAEHTIKTVRGTNSVTRRSVGRVGG